MSDKLCPKCNIVKNVLEFGFQGIYVKGYCKPCNNNYKRSEGQIDKTRLNTKRKDLKRAFGITIEDYDKLYEEQEGKCKICHVEAERFELCVDHCHSSNIVRGLLCNTCNIGIGMFKNDVLTILKAADYLLNISDKKGEHLHAGGSKITSRS